MKEINGYVFIPKSKDFPPFMYGSEEPKRDRGFEQFEKHLFPYHNIKIAMRNAKIFLKQRKMKRADILEVWLKYAEDGSEFNLFKEETGLVAMLMLQENGNSLHLHRTLVGPINHEKNAHMGYIPGAELVDNGYKTFDTANGEITPYKRVLYLHSELRRQGQHPCTIGTFKLKRRDRVIIP